MEAQVQSKHKLDEEFLVNIWRRSSAPHPDDCFNDWRRKPQTNLGTFSSDSAFFWANWISSNKGLIPVFNLNTISKPEEWRVVVNLDDAEKEKSVIFEEDELSVYVYGLDSGELIRFLVIGIGVKDWPQLLEIQVKEIPKWLEEKISIAKEERSPRAALGRLSNLAARLEKLKQRRG